MVTNDIPPAMRGFVSRACFWLADNYAVWQPFALGLAVGALVLALTIMAIIWETTK